MTWVTTKYSNIHKNSEETLQTKRFKSPKLPPIPEFIQPQHLWPYIQQNLIQQNHLVNSAFITNVHHSHNLHHSSHLSPHANNDGAPLPTNNTNKNHSPDLQTDSRDNKVIAKPLPSRPMPFTGNISLHHGLNHPHLHSLLAHCRNPYMGGEFAREKLRNVEKY